VTLLSCEALSIDGASELARDVSIGDASLFVFDSSSSSLAYVEAESFLSLSSTEYALEGDGGRMVFSEGARTVDGELSRVLLGVDGCTAGGEGEVGT
jgi:hypothetical protein